MYVFWIIPIATIAIFAIVFIWGLYAVITKPGHEPMEMAKFHEQK